jgi:nitrite reductase/ring-hydroxylating ferredoxin subunit
MERIQIASSDAVEEGKSHVVKADGKSVLLTRVKGKLCAIENKCPHLGMPLAKGKIVDGVIQCPWHGSKFDLCTGSNVDWVSGLPGGITTPKWTHKLIAMGRKPAPVKVFDVSEDAGAIFLKI